MIKILIYAGLAYIAYVLLKYTRLASKSERGAVKEKGSYKNLEIKEKLQFSIHNIYLSCSLYYLYPNNSMKNQGTMYVWY